MNFKTGIVSDVAPPNAQPVSLGTVKIVTYGPNRIPKARIDCGRVPQSAKPARPGAVSL